MTAFDAIVIGPGCEERIATLLLARSGRRVLLLGGTDLGADGYPRTDGDAGEWRRGWVPAQVARDLDLEGNGLLARQPDPWAVVPLASGDRLELWTDVQKTAASIRRLSPHDAERWPAFCERMHRMTDLLAPLCVSPPPDPLARGAGDLIRLGAAALRARTLGRQAVEDFLRLFTLPVADLLDDWFECEALKGALGAAALAHLRHGPRAGGTALRLLQEQLGNPPGVFRAPLTNLEPVLARMISAHASIEERRPGAIASIAIRAGRVAAVVLPGGEEIAAPVVVSGADPARTLLEWSDPAWLDPLLARALRNVRSRGVVARVRLELDAPPGFETLCIAPSLDHLERGADDAKYGRVSSAPFVECLCVATHAGRFALEAHVQYAPYSLAEGSWDEARRGALRDKVIGMLGEAQAGFAGHVRRCTVSAPPDLEQRYGWPQGQAHHAESTLDQMLWMRPVPELANYRTPIGGLYLCGPAMHPGGGIAGAAGRIAALRVLEDLRGN